MQLRRVALANVSEKTWGVYVQTNSNGEQKSAIAGKLHVDPSTVGRWISGHTQPKPLQVIAFARAYGLSPIPGLIAAGYLTPEDVSGEVVIESSPTLDSIATHTLIDELERRLEVMSHYAGWIRAIAAGGTTPARLSEHVLRYLDPTAPPRSVQGADFAAALSPHVIEVPGPDGERTFGLPDELTRARMARNVGGPSQTQEVAADTPTRHEDDTDDYTP